MLRRRPRQSGYAITATVLIIALVLSAYVLTALHGTGLRNEQNRATAIALALAREALIGRAAADTNRPGSLPCPDLDNDGQLQSAGELFGNCATIIGRLPWRTLGIPDLRDDSGERLWYAVSPNFFDATGVSINDATAGTLSVSGAAPANNVAAIVFAAGAPLSNQARGTAIDQNNPANYLEGANATGGPVFAAQYATNLFNDQLRVITVADLMRVVTRRVANEITAALNSYFQPNALLPTPAGYSDPGCGANRTAAECTPSGSAAAIGRLPRNVTVGTWPPLLRNVGTWFDASWRTSVSYSIAADCATTPACAPNGFMFRTTGAAKVTLVVGSATALTMPLVAR